MGGEFVTLSEAAKQLDVDRHLLGRRIKAGKLSAFEDPRDARKRLLRVADVEAFRALRPEPRREPQAASVA